MGGYTKIFENLLEGIEIKLKQISLKIEPISKILPKTLFTPGPIDKFFNYEAGKLNYRSSKI